MRTDVIDVLRVEDGLIVEHWGVPAPASYADFRSGSSGDRRRWIGFATLTISSR
jgi:hypothetical protein